MRRSCVLAGFLLALLVRPALAEEPTYRLSGIAGPAEALKMLIEMPDGSQQWLGRGDRLGDGEILEIASDHVRLRFADGERTIRPTFGRPFGLLGSAGSRSGQAGAAAVKVEMRQLTKQTLAVLERLATQTSSGGLVANINSVLQVPPESRIYMIDGVDVPSHRVALNTVIEALETRGLAHLWITGASGDGEVYLVPEETATVQ